MLRLFASAVLISVALTAWDGCGGKSGAGPTAPVAPSPAGPTSPPSVDVNGIWFGDLSDSSGPGKLVWHFTISGNSVNGSGTLHQCCDQMGTVRIDDTPLTGTLSGAMFSFAGTVSRPNCPVTFTGTANVTDTAITGTYSGTDCRARIANGQISLSRADLTGTWSGPMGALQYFARPVSWQLAQSGDGITGSISGWRTNPQGPQSVSGTLSSQTSTLTFTSSYVVNLPGGGTCQETFNGTATLHVAYNAPNFRPPISETPTFQMMGTFAGSNCQSPTFITNGAVSLIRQ